MDSSVIRDSIAEIVFQLARPAGVGRRGGGISDVPRQVRVAGLEADGVFAEEFASARGR